MQSRASLMAQTGLILIIVAAAAAWLPVGREAAVNSLNRRGIFEVIVCQGKDEDGWLHFEAGRPHLRPKDGKVMSWTERFVLHSPYRIKGPRWNQGVKGNSVDVCPFRQGVFYHAELRGDTIVFFGQ
ncbi:hypothetical protein KW800_01265 [Candidatus Parcubacteria bacterium]|nr:hypothetical protein [Candidatus Parcubacteria bacterium]